MNVSCKLVFISHKACLSTYLLYDVDGKGLFLYFKEWDEVSECNSEVLSSVAEWYDNGQPALRPTIRGLPVATVYIRMLQIQLFQSQIIAIQLQARIGIYNQQT